MVLPGTGRVSGLLAFSDRALTLDSPFPPSNPYPSFCPVSLCAAIGISICPGAILLDARAGKKKESVGTLRCEFYRVLS